MSDTKRSDKKKDYVSPRIVHSEKIKARAVTCARIDDNACAGGPLTS